MIQIITEITEIEGKIPSITGLATNLALTAVKNKLLDVSSLKKRQITIQKLLKLKKKVSDHNHDKYITSPEFNNLAAKIFTGGLAQADSVTKTLVKGLPQIKQSICL